MIRKATPADLQEIVDCWLGIQSKESNMRPSRERALALVRECVSSATHFVWVAEKEGKIGGVLMAVAHPNMAHERCGVTVVQWHSKIQGDGASLAREFLRWARKRPIIKSILINPEHVSDPRAGKLLERMGLNQRTIYMEMR